MLVDSHSHLNDTAFAGKVEAALARAKEHGVELIINVGFDMPSSELGVRQAAKYTGIYAAVGIHPHDARTASQENYLTLRQLAANDKVVAIGETGLDYYRDLSPRPLQREVFRAHLGLARELHLPVIVHDRDAHADAMTILREEKVQEIGGVMHCFSGSWELARVCLDMGLYISIAGPVTYSNARRLQEAARLVPMDRLLVETDAPYLTPEPLRGKRNEPANVYHTAAFIASLRQMPMESLAEATAENARRLFNIKKQ